jgi:hypothetical protein
MKSSRLEQAIPWAIGILCTLVVWYQFPPTPLAFNDDFGYLKSIAETLRHGRPWTDEWLGPWAASLSVLSVLLFKAFGSFRLATYGLQAASAGAIVGFSISLFRIRRVPWVLTLMWTLALISFPTFLFKLSEFGAVPLYLACVLGAIWSAETRRWILFTLFWFIAVANRQSALLWLALPAGIVIENFFCQPRNWIRSLLRLGGIAAGGGLVYFCLQHGMNRTNAQVVMLPSVWSTFNASVFLLNFSIAFGLFVVAAGVGMSMVPSAGTEPRWIPLRIAAIAAIVALWAFSARKHIQFEHTYLNDHAGRRCLAVLALLSVAGWCLSRPSIRFRFIAAGAAMSALLGLLTTVWDYYLIDVVVFGLFSAFPSLPAPGLKFMAWLKHVPWKKAVQVLSLTGAIVLLWFQSGFVISIQRNLEWYYAAISLTEQALRDGQIQPADMTTAPFGLRGWHLYPYFITHDGIGRYIAAFEGYVRPDALRLQADPVELSLPAMDNGRLHENETLLSNGIFPFGRRQKLRFSLIKNNNPQAPSLQINAGEYHFESFPLNDSEWQQYLLKKNP